MADKLQYVGLNLFIFFFKVFYVAYILRFKPFENQIAFKGMRVVNLFNSNLLNIIVKIITNIQQKQRLIPTS